MELRYIDDIYMDRQILFLMSSSRTNLVEISIDYESDTIRLVMDWEPGYLIKEAIYVEDGREIVFNGLDELVNDTSIYSTRILEAHMIWLLYNFNREMSLVKNEGMELCEKISIWIEALENQMSPSLLAVSYNPDRRDIILDLLDTQINSLYDIVDYMDETVNKHCKRISKFLKGIYRYKKNDRTRRLFYEVYAGWLSSELREKSLMEYRDYGLKEVNKKLLKIASPLIKSKLLHISADPFEKVNLQAAVNLRICEDSSLYISIINSSINLLEYIRDNVREMDELMSADIEKIYDKLDDVVDEMGKLVANVKSLYMNLEPL